MPVGGSSVGNTTPLGDSQATISVSSFKAADYAGQLAAQEVARHNYSQRSISDAKLKQLRQLLYARVKSWLPQDKSRILTEYGFQPSGTDDLDALVVECLIIYMDPETLDNILKMLVVDQRNIKNDFKKAESKAEAMRRAYFVPRNFEDAYAAFREMRQSSGGGRSLKSDVRRFLKGYDKGHKGNRLVRGRYKTLDKEIKRVLKDFYGSNYDLVALAASMGIEVDEMGSRKDLERDISEKCILYVEMITGKNKNVQLAAGFPDTDPFDDILQYTSFSFVTGRPQMSIYELLEKRKAARVAQSQIKAGIAGMKKTSLRFGRGKAGLQEVTGRKGKITARSLEGTNDRGVLKGLSTEQLIETALRYGIDVPNPDKISVGELKLKIYERMARQKAALKKLDKQIKKAERKGKNSVVEDLRAQRTALEGKMRIFDQRALDAQPLGGGGLPLVKFDRDGNVATEVVQAVPVYVIGYGQPGLSKDIVKNMTPKGQPVTRGEAIIEQRERLKEIIGGQTGMAARRAARKVAKEEYVISGLRKGRREKLLNKAEKIMQKRVRKLLDAPERGDAFRAKYGIDRSVLERYYAPKRTDDGVLPDDRAAEQGETNTGRRMGLVGIPYYDHEVNALRVMVINSPVVTIGGGGGGIGDPRTNPFYEYNPLLLPGSKNGVANRNRLAQQYIQREGLVEGRDYIAPNDMLNGSYQFRNEKGGFSYKRKSAMTSVHYLDAHGNPTGLDDLRNSALSGLDPNQLGAAGVNSSQSLFALLLGGKKWAKAVERLAKKNKKEREKQKANSNVDKKDLSNYLSSTAKTLGVQTLSTKEAMPVFVVNKEVSTDMLAWTKKMIETVLDGLSLIPLFGFAFTGIKRLMESQGLLDIDLFAKGGKVQAEANRRFSSFISGDSPTGKVNEERVDIDWQRKSFKVTPIQKYANGGEESTSGKVSALSSSEKNAPMSVGLSSHLISYKTKIDGDDGSGKALKVYMVNDLLSQTVKTEGSTSTTLSDLLVAMEAHLASMEAYASAAAEQRNAILTATTTAAQAAASSGGGGNYFTSGGSFPTELDSILRGE